MAKKETVKPVKKANSKKDETFEEFVAEQPVRTTVGNRKVKQLVTSAPHYKFEVKGDSIACKVLSKIVPTEGEFEGKLIGWNVVNIDTGEQVMLGNTHQIEKAFTIDQDGQELWSTGTQFLVTWLGKSNLGNGKTFNNFDIGQIEE